MAAHIPSSVPVSSLDFSIAIWEFPKIVDPTIVS